MDLTQRQQMIFKTIVEQFTVLAEPIGSKALLPLLGIQVSSATIRNDMAALEKAGLLEKTHTSSGRIPSLEGYRYYIEHLMEFNLDSEVEHSLKELFTKRHFSIDEIVEVSSALLSEMTHLTSVAFGPRLSDQHLISIQLIPVDVYSAIAVLVSDTGQSQSKLFQFAQPVSTADLQTFASLLDKHLHGAAMDQLAYQLQQLKGLAASQMAAQEMLFDAFMTAFMEMALTKPAVHGRFHILAQPEFSDLDKLQELMQILEDSALFKAWMLQKSNVAIPIGSRNELIQIGECSVVASRFKCSQNEEGQLMVIGPNRMNYAQVIPLIDSISDMIEDVFSSKGGPNG